eukprot:Ihof_evm2s509 gene=Ihof_evmTU2s509
MEKLLALDGSILEGGGQVLRNTLAYSCLLHKPIKVFNVRLNRKPPGLKAQHLHGIQLVGRLSEGKLQGDSLRSSEVTLWPGDIKVQGKGKGEGERESVDPGTAGSITLLIQISLPCMLFAGDRCYIDYKGGTNASMAPQIDYTAQVFQPFAQRFGVNFDLKIHRRGFYPAGGGKVEVSTKPVRQIQAVTVLDRAGVLPDHIPNNMAKTAKTIVQSYLSTLPPANRCKIDIETVRYTKEEAVSNGCGILLVAHTSTGCIIGGSAVGERGQGAKAVGKEAADMLVANIRHGGCVDEYLQDQMIIFMALAYGTSRIKTGPLTLHTQTAIHFANQVSG